MGPRRTFRSSLALSSMSSLGSAGSRTSRVQSITPCTSKNNKARSLRVAIMPGASEAPAAEAGEMLGGACAAPGSKVALLLEVAQELNLRMSLWQIKERSMRWVGMSLGERIVGNALSTA
eukprot:scaffold238944_cov33-Tisochrysis_lutea.AAC.2